MSQSGVINFVNQIPTGENPFLLTAAFMNSMVRNPPTPTWSRVLTSWSLFAYLIMFVQSIFLVYQRLKLDLFTKLKYNELGLLIVNVIDASAVAYLMFTALTVAYLILELLKEHHVLVSEEGSLFLFGCRFLFIMPSSGAYLWVCVCRCAAILWKSDFVSNLPSNTGAQLRLGMKWSINVFFLAGLLAPLPLVFAFYGGAAGEMRKMATVLDKIHETLISAAATYDPATYSKLALLAMLIPAEGLVTILHKMERNIVAALTVYAVSSTLTVITFIPSMTLCIGALYKHSISQEALDSAVGKCAQISASKQSLQIQQKRRNMVYNGMAVFTSTAVFLPVLFWQLFNSSEGFSKSPKWIAVSYHGSTVPFSFAGNIVLWLLNVVSRNALRETQAQLRADPAFTYVAEPSSKTTSVSFKHLLPFITVKQKAELETYHSDGLNKTNRYTVR